MCLAIPARILSIRPDGMAEVALEGVTKSVSLMLVEGVEVGEYVIVHAGFALSRLDPGEAERTLALFAEAGGGA